MSNYFTPSLSYWAGKGTNIASSGIATPSSALNSSTLLLLVHGYNNTQQDASDSYVKFVELQNEIGHIRSNIVGVYWPGANWEGPLYYMQAIGQAKKVAPILANDLVQAAKARGYLKVDIIAHSLGCRLVLEMVKSLLALKNANNDTLSGLILGRVIFMAGAVPTKYLETLNDLKQSLESFTGSVSIYSEKDLVLRYAFPIGQTAARERFFPVALGRTIWTMGPFVSPPIKQVSNRDAGHGDYWGGNDKNLSVKRQAAKIINDNILVTSLLPRQSESRTGTLERSTHSRVYIEGRQTPIRTISRRF